MAYDMSSKETEALCCLECTANNFGLMYSRKKNEAKLDPKIHLYISKAVQDILSGTK
jgi:hypothetical protein